MEKNNHSAEKELLKTIEESSERDDKNRFKNLAVNSGELKSRFSFFYNKFKNNFLFPHINIFKQQFISSEGGFNFGAVQIILKLCVFFFLFCYLVIVGKGIYKLNHIPSFNVSATEPAKIETKRVANLLKEFAYYSSSLIKRNIFTPQIKEEKTIKATELSKIRQFTDNLKIVGISWSEDATKRFAMIENIEKDVTYFLQEKDKILNLIVKDISKDKVILSYQDEEIILQ